MHNQSHYVSLYQSKTNENHAHPQSQSIIQHMTQSPHSNIHFSESKTLQPINSASEQNYFIPSSVAGTFTNNPLNHESNSSLYSYPMPVNHLNYQMNGISSNNNYQQYTNSMKYRGAQSNYYNTPYPIRSVRCSHGNVPMMAQSYNSNNHNYKNNGYRRSFGNYSTIKNLNASLVNSGHKNMNCNNNSRVNSCSFNRLDAFLKPRPPHSRDIVVIIY